MKTLEPKEASTLALLAQYLSVPFERRQSEGEGLPPDYENLRLNLGVEANRIADALIEITKPQGKRRKAVPKEYAEAAESLLGWVKTNQTAAF